MDRALRVLLSSSNLANTNVGPGRGRGVFVPDWCEVLVRTGW